ncbi:hypothetical protein HOLleu_38647 [Holothuria leucospilota]|uniref:Uncharacterized protein n=1 Tax=Holothuria leucospilota TaxID=206669 RepID=A0A9Q0YG95_HOLLE|nr:hypothetical protein HOLleu_38647 [Holothuria leucospilota]
MMVHHTLYKVLVVEVGLVLVTLNATYVEYVTSGAWDGVGFYISAKRETIQQTLDAYHDSVSNGCCGEGPRLFIPRKSVFPELQMSDHHPVSVDFGYLESHDFDDYLKINREPSISISGPEVAVSIPYLAADSNGPPVYTLALAHLYEQSRGDIPKTNFLYPYIPVDEIQITDIGAVVRNGSEELGVSFIRHNHPCKAPPSTVSEKFDEFLYEEFHLGLPEPDFSFCDRHSFRSDFCTNLQRVKCAIHGYAPHVCQMYKTDNASSCEASVKIINITPFFRDFILLGNDSVNIIATESYASYKSLVGLKYPCQK